MSKNQLEVFLEFLMEKKRAGSRIKAELDEYAKSDFRFGYVILNSGILDD